MRSNRHVRLTVRPLILLVLAVLLALPMLVAAPVAHARPDFPGWDPADVTLNAAWRRAQLSQDGTAGGQGSGTPSEPTGPRSLSRGDTGSDVVALQLALCDLGFMPYDPSRGSCADQSDGVFGVMTRDAVYAVQKLHWLRRDGIFGPATRAALAGMSPITWPEFCDARASTVWCVDQQRQLAWVRDWDGRVRVHHTSTGGRYYYESRTNPGTIAFAATPVGRWRIYGAQAARHETEWGELEYTSCPSWWCLHPYESVPVYAASHGCVRRPMYLGAWGFSIARVGTYVDIVNQAPST